VGYRHNRLWINCLARKALLNGALHLDWQAAGNPDPPRKGDTDGAIPPDHLLRQHDAMRAGGQLVARCRREQPPGGRLPNLYNKAVADADRWLGRCTVEGKAAMEIRLRRRELDGDDPLIDIDDSEARFVALGFLVQNLTGGRTGGW
jgi:hypothetical protein